EIERAQILRIDERAVDAEPRLADRRLAVDNDLRFVDAARAPADFRCRRKTEGRARRNIDRRAYLDHRLHTAARVHASIEARRMQLAETSTIDDSRRIEPGQGRFDIEWMRGIETDTALRLRGRIVDIHARLPDAYRASRDGAIEARAVGALRELGANVLRGKVAASLDRRRKPRRLERRIHVVHIQLLAAELKGHLVRAYTTLAPQLAGVTELRFDRIERERIVGGANPRRQRRQWNPAGVYGARNLVDHLHSAAQFAVLGRCRERSVEDRLGRARQEV